MFSKSVVILFLLLLSFLFIKQRIEFWIVISYFTLSLLTFSFYGIDKRQAIKDRWRISERTLLLLGGIGGWPGALLAQNTFRHKTKKRPFIVILWLSIVTNISVFGYLQYLN
jgi:uncharacterized membrane protein YsdA (DUF1294 family)